MAKSLDEFIEENSSFITLADGESIEGKYEGYEVTSSFFNPDKEVIQYKINGKVLSTSSVKTAKEFAKVKEGDIVKVTRIGTGNKTLYKVEKIL